MFELRYSGLFSCPILQLSGRSSFPRFVGAVGAAAMHLTCAALALSLGSVDVFVPRARRLPAGGRCAAECEPARMPGSRKLKMPVDQ